MANRAVEGWGKSTAKFAAAGLALLVSLEQQVEAAYRRENHPSREQALDYEAFSRKITGLIKTAGASDEKKTSAEEKPKKEHSSLKFIPTVGTTLTEKERVDFIDPSKKLKEGELAVASIDDNTRMVVKVHKIFDRVIEYAALEKAGSVNKEETKALKSDIRIRFSTFLWGEYVPKAYWESICSPKEQMKAGDFALLRRSKGRGCQMVKIEGFETDVVVRYDNIAKKGKQEAKFFCPLKPELNRYLQNTRMDASEPAMEGGELSFDWEEGPVIGERSALAFTFAAGFEGYQSSDKYHLQLPNLGLHYILHTSVKPISKEPLVSLGSTQTREIIILNPKSSELGVIFKALSEKIIEKEKRKAGLLTTEEILKSVIKYVRELLPLANVDAKLQAIFKEMQDDSQAIKLKHTNTSGSVVSIPAIPLERFVERGFGLCRQHALLCFFLIGQLINRGFMPGEVFHIRDNVKEGSHIWVVYRSGGKKPEEWHIDTTWDVLYRLDREDQLQTLKHLYGEKPISNALEKTRNKIMVLKSLT